MANASLFFYEVEEDGLFGEGGVSAADGGGKQGFAGDADGEEETVFPVTGAVYGGDF